jgi:hypothetical protein
MDVIFYTASGLNSFFITFWQNFTDDLLLKLVLPDGRSTSEISSVDRTNTLRFGDTLISINYGQPNHYNENQEIFFQASSRQGALPVGLWTIQIRSVKTVEGRFDIWLPVTEIVSAGTAFSNPDPYTTLTLPATADNVITVGGYDSRVGSFAEFSGRGYTRTGIIKPDLVAPAVSILTPRKGGGYDSFTGTSVAAPFVTGSVALMMEWGIVKGNDPFLYGQRAKAFLKSGASRTPGLSYPNPEWGYGKLCLSNAMDLLQAYL